MKHGVNKISGKPITHGDMMRLLYLEGGTSNINDLTGLEYATNLKVLDLGAVWTEETDWNNTNDIRDLSPLSNLTELKVLKLRGNNITDLSPLRGLINQVPPPDIDDPNTRAAWDMSFAAIAFHWGLQGWAGYAVIGLAIAYFTYNRGLPLALRSAFYPLLRERVWGLPGHIIDTLAIFATLFGLAPSLGLGAQQVAAGLNYLFDIPATHTTAVAIILLITVIATGSVLSGLNVGIKRLSQVNICITIGLFLFVIVAGPTGAIFSGFFRGLGTYIVQIVPFSNWVGRTDSYFIHDWSAFHLAWWLAWGPFVGSFIARISKGRTVRQFLFCVLILPMLLILLCMSAFGGTAIHQFLTDGFTGVMDSVGEGKPELALFKMLEQLPLTGITSFVSIVLLIIFFITSSDSGSLVVDTIAAGGKFDAPVGQRVFWCSAEGLVAIALLLGGGLRSLQALAVASGLPFAIIVIGMGGCTWIALRKEA